MRWSRQRMLSQLALAAAVMSVLIALAEAGSSSTSGDRSRIHSPVERGAAGRIEALLGGIPQHGAVLGELDAPVTLQFFADLECEEARLFVIGALPFLIRRWVRDGKLRIEYRANPEETLWRDIYYRQQVAVLAAGRQGRAWDYLDFFYHEQGPEFSRYATDHFLTAIANQVSGLDIARWREDRQEPALTRHLERDHLVAQRHSIDLTPAFLIGPTGGSTKFILHYSLTESAAFDEAIESTLAGTDG